MRIRNFVVLVVVVLQGCVGTATQISCMFDPPVEPEPKVEFAEFEISLCYTENGEEKKIDDVVACKYVGRACDGRGLHSDWSYHLASGNNKIVLKNPG